MNDFTLTNAYDLDLSEGDLSISLSNQRHLEHLLISHQGQWKASPVTGCNLPKAISGSIDRMLDRHIRIQLEADGFHIQQLQITPQGISLKATPEHEK